ncbi:ROK family transcriptional regulator [Caldalkalibacillus salinus]|uniref:ROK family transcriptional regulator n=1 Tax=Caldalkalibacillus salinus TaxID=2803787 RepID=UPI0019229663|nr:ROK family protein [Caldalkalibacillus salinus]
MDKMVTGSFQLMKQMNKTLILDIIRTHGPISRAEIAKMTKLTPPTVTNLVKDLLSTGMVVEGERMNSTGGRKAINLQINPTAYYVIGVNVGVSKVSVVVTDLMANVVVESSSALQHVSSDRIMDVVVETIRRCMQSSRVKADKFMGIGVGMHGLVNAEEGVAVFAPNFGLRDVHVKEIIEQTFDIPTYLDNDVRAMALGESWFGHGQNVDNFIFINVGMGIGAGIVLQEEVYRGISESAGEIGHTTVVEDGPQCNCGNHGCLEVMAAGPAIAKRAVKAINDGAQTRLTKRVNDQLDEITAKIIHEEAVDGDPLCRQIIEDTGKYLGIGIANLINIFNPAKIIIGGGVSNAGQMLLEPLIHTALVRAMEVPASKVSIETTPLHDRVGPIGAATLVLKHIFKQPNLG